MSRGKRPRPQVEGAAAATVCRARGTPATGDTTVTPQGLRSSCLLVGTAGLLVLLGLTALARPPLAETPCAPARCGVDLS